MIFPKMAIHTFSGAIVGTIPSPQALAVALRLNKNVVDFFELRVEHFSEAADLDHLERCLLQLHAPLIVTVRHPLEGGANALTFRQRRALFQRFLPYAKLIDIELRSASRLKDVMEEAKDQDIGIILSHHDFHKTPPLTRLHTLRRKAADAGCAVFKVATTAQTAQDLATLLRFMTDARPPVPALAVMGMGTFGKLSRVTLAAAGSVLNYSYLEKAQVPGQWPAALLKERLAELVS